MSDRGRDDRRTRIPPGLSRQDLELWRKVTEGVEPIDRSRLANPLQSPGAAAPEPSGDRPPSRKPKPPPTSTAVRHQAPAQPVRPQENDLSGIDRRTRQRLFRGQVEVDARIDLHGLTQAEAKIALRGFLSTAIARGYRLVLVITGKGAAPFARHTLHSGEIYHDPERQGVLRRALPQWLGEREFSDMVTGFQPAHPKHGGGGAFYVRLRRAKGPGR